QKGSSAYRTVGGRWSKQLDSGGNHPLQGRAFRRRGRRSEEPRRDGSYRPQGFVLPVVSPAKSSTSLKFLVPEFQMGTYSAKPADIQRRWFVIDVEDLVLGRCATQIASILKGKLNPRYTPSFDTGDHVVV